MIHVNKVVAFYDVDQDPFYQCGWSCCCRGRAQLYLSRRRGRQSLSDPENEKMALVRPKMWKLFQWHWVELRKELQTELMKNSNDRYINLRNPLKHRCTWAWQWRWVRRRSQAAMSSPKDCILVTRPFIRLFFLSLKGKVARLRIFFYWPGNLPSSHTCLIVWFSLEVPDSFYWQRDKIVAPLPGSLVNPLETPSTTWTLILDRIDLKTTHCHFSFATGIL